MKNSNILPIIIHSIILLFLQTFLLVGFSIPLFDRYISSAFVYPLIIILLPLSTSISVSLIIAFTVGLFIDFFYNSPGVHSGALVFTAFLRPYILKSFEPRGGYRTDNLPTAYNYGFVWFFTYSGLLMLCHLFVYFTLDVFTFVFADKIFVNTLASFVVSYVIVLLYQITIRQ
jgi:hypothetical protein